MTVYYENRKLKWIYVLVSACSYFLIDLFLPQSPPLCNCHTSKLPRILTCVVQFHFAISHVFNWNSNNKLQKYNKKMKATLDTEILASKKCRTFVFQENSIIG